jgi:hypothetical protein
MTQGVGVVVSESAWGGACAARLRTTNTDSNRPSLIALPLSIGGDVAGIVTGAANASVPFVPGDAFC